MLRADLLLWHWERWTITPLLAFSIFLTVSLLSLLSSTMLHQTANLVFQVSMSSPKLGLGLLLFTDLKIQVLFLIDSLRQLLRGLCDVTLRVLVHDLQLIE